jgi:hypothetical protein
MAKNGDESTAVNELINLVASAKPLPVDPEDDLMFRRPPPPPKRGPRMTSTIPAMRGAGEVAPLPRTRAPAGTQQGPVIAAAQSIRMATAPGGAPTIPPIPHGSPPPVRAEMPANIPIAAPFEAMMAPTARPQADVTWVGAKPRKRVDWKGVALKVSIPMAALIVLGVFVGAYFGGYFDSNRNGEKRAPSAVAETSKIVPAKLSQPAAPEPTPVEAPAPTEPVATVDSVAQVEEAPAVAITEAAKPVPTPAGQPVFVDVRIDSQPAGATVMIVDRGKTAFLGTTPLRTAVDPSRQYDLVFTYTNKPTQLEHLDPKATQHLEVILGKPGAKNVEAAEVARVETKVLPKPERIERQAKPVRVAKREPEPEPKVVTMPETKSSGRIASKIPAFDPAPAEPAPKAAAKIETKVEPPADEVAPAPTVAAPAKKTRAELRAEEKALKDAARLAKKAELDAKKQELAAARIAKKQEQELARASKAAEAEAARIAKKQAQEQKAAEAEAARLAKKARGTFDGMLETPGKGSKKKLGADKPVAETAAGGVIMVTSKPPCEILIDGKSTGLTTPQNAIPVSLGKHKVTLVNTEIGVKKTLTVTVTAGEATKVIQDFTK